MGEVINIQHPTNHPYLETLKKGVEQQKRLLYCLHQRLERKGGFKDNFEKNEYEILCIRTRSEIGAVKRAINEKEAYYQKYMQKFIVDEKECNENFEQVVANAKASNNTVIKDLLAKINWIEVDKAIDVKIAVYQRFKSLL